MANVLTIGEAMGLFVSDNVCSLENANHFSKYVCGAEVNFAIGMSRLNHKTSYISKVGGDPIGKSIKSFLELNNVDCSYLSFDNDNRTGLQLKSKVTDGDPDVANFRKYSAFYFITPDYIDNVKFDGINHLHITGIPLAVSKSARETVIRLVTLAKKQGLSISFDPNLRPSMWETEKEMVETINSVAKYADIILPGIKEGKILTGLSEAEKIADFYLNMGIKTVIIKDGAKGAFLKNSSEKIFVPAFHIKNIVDTVGAGDGFAVGIISALLEELPLTKVLVRGNAIGGLAIQFAGDNEGLPNPEQLADFIKENTI